MKNKRIIIIFSIILFLALIVVLSSFLFKIDSVEPLYATNPILNINKDEVNDKLKQYKGTSFFFLDEKKLANKLETDIPYLKVVRIERKFPKTVYITVQERIEVYCFKIKEDYTYTDYIYTDYNCKVLRIEKAEHDIYEFKYESKYGKVIDVEVNKRLISNYQIGEILEFYDYGATEFLTELYLNTTNDPIFFRNYIKSININNFYIPDSNIGGISFSGSIVEIEMETGAAFKLFKTSEYGKKFILYINKVMENDESVKINENGKLTTVQIDHIYGKYEIRRINEECEISGGPFYKV